MAEIALLPPGAALLWERDGLGCCWRVRLPSGRLTLDARSPAEAVTFAWNVAEAEALGLFPDRPAGPRQSSMFDHIDPPTAAGQRKLGVQWKGRFAPRNRSTRIKASPKK